jgi:hypothetical protein
VAAFCLDTSEPAAQRERRVARSSGSFERAIRGERRGAEDHDTHPDNAKVRPQRGRRSAIAVRQPRNPSRGAGVHSAGIVRGVRTRDEARAQPPFGADGLYPSRSVIGRR